MMESNTNVYLFWKESLYQTQLSEMRFHTCLLRLELESDKAMDIHSDIRFGYSWKPQVECPVRRYIHAIYTSRVHSIVQSIKM
jgi:hypothetical protein